MSYTIFDACIDAIKFMCKNPKVIRAIIGNPLTRRKTKATYNSENTANYFDIDMLDQVRVQDPTYLSYSDTALQSMIDSAVPLDLDITVDVDGVQEPG